MSQVHSVLLRLLNRLWTKTMPFLTAGEILQILQQLKHTNYPPPWNCIHKSLVHVNTCVLLGGKAPSKFSKGPRKGLKPTEPRQEAAAASAGWPRCDVPGGVFLIASHGLLCSQLSLPTHTTLTPLCGFSLCSLTTFLPFFWPTFLTLPLRFWGWEQVLLVF